MTQQPIIGPEDLRAIMRDSHPEPDPDPETEHSEAQQTGAVFEESYRGDGL